MGDLIFWVGLCCPVWAATLFGVGMHYWLRSVFNDVAGLGNSAQHCAVRPSPTLV